MPRMEKLNLQSPIFKVVNIPNILFAAILYMISLPPLVKTKPPAMIIIVICLIELYFIIGYLVQHKRSCHDISCILFAFFAIWEYLSKTGKAHSLLMPPMENVLYVLYSHRGELLKGLVSSLELMLWGVTIALASSVVFGILVGWFTRPREAIMPIVRVISPIPALAYTTYVVGCMPSFKSSSIVVIFLSVFWPLFSQVIRTVGTMDRRIIESAKVMNVGSITMIKDIVYPYVLPTVLRYLPSSLSTAFMCLTGAEMIGASSGLGFFIRKYAEYANYTNVLAGIIFMGLVVTMLNSLVKLVQKKFIKW